MARQRKQSDKTATDKVGKSVKVIFVPIGLVNVHLYTPSGNEYNIKPREVFKIAAEDVDWFFNDWEWCFRQRLVLAADYHPTCGYHDPKAGEKDYQPHSDYADPKAGEQDYHPQSNYDPKPTEPARPIDAQPVVTTAEAEAEVEVESDSKAKEHEDA